MDAINTYKQFLMKKGTGNDFAKVVDIKSTPDMGAAPEMLETTTKSDGMSTYIPGIVVLDSSGLQFETNYNLADYKVLKGLEGAEETYAVWYGGTESGGVVTPTGSDGKWQFDGILSVYPTGSGVNEVQNMNITIAPTSPITFVEPT